jgi:hypothetical protein
MNTVATNSMGPDGFTWANAPAIMDGHGNLIAITEDSSNNHHFTYLNASGSTWADASLSEGFLTRGSLWLDTAHNLLHVLWSTTITNGGVVYRRYQVQYSGNNITDILSDSGITIGGGSTRTNVVLDDGSGLAVVEQPVLIGLPTENILLAVWGAANATAGEVRAAMVPLGANINAGQTLANWVAPVSASTTGLGANTAPATGSYSILATGTGLGGNIPCFSVTRSINGTHAKDLFLVWWDGTNYNFRRATWSAGSGNWSGGLASGTLICPMVRAGSNAGYGTKGSEGPKSQLIAAPSEDANGNMIVGLATWKDNTNGDTWGFARVAPDNSLTLIDAFSWGGPANNGTPNLYPTGDACYEALHGQILVTYITQTQVFAQLFNPTSLAPEGSALSLITRAFDIPLIARSAIGSSIGVIGRDAVNTPTPPYHGYFITMSER